MTSSRLFGEKLPTDFTLIGQFISPDEHASMGLIMVSNERIVQIGRHTSDLPKDHGRLIKIPFLMTPGFVDLHIHGGFGYDFKENNAKSISAFARKLAARGTTSFCLAFAADEVPKLARAAKSIPEMKNDGSRLVGIHFEGPFINPNRAGLINKRYAATPTKESCASLFDAAVSNGRRAVMFTMAPEINGAIESARMLRRKGAIVSAGHTNADYDTALEAFHSGFSHVTHLFNAMRPFHHRHPGIVGAALESPVSVDLIADGSHVSPCALALVVKIKGITKVAMISDAIKLAGMRGGAYTSERGIVTVRNGAARWANGRIAGSSSFQERALSTQVGVRHMSLRNLVYMMTKTPAELLGRKDIGRLETGASADITFVDTQRARVVATLVNGSHVYINR